jgi:hypothetical protein
MRYLQLIGGGEVLTKIRQTNHCNAGQGAKDRLAVVERNQTFHEECILVLSRYVRLTLASIPRQRRFYQGCTDRELSYINPFFIQCRFVIVLAWKLVYSFISPSHPEFCHFSYLA